MILQTPNGLAAHLVTFREAKNKFSDDMRQTLVELQGNGNMPANKYKTVIKTVHSKHSFNRKLGEKDLPCRGSYFDSFMQLKNSGFTQPYYPHGTS